MEVVQQHEVATPFIDLAAANDPCCYAFMRTLDLSDERTDVTDHLRQVYLRARDTWRGGNGQENDAFMSNENAPLIAMQPRGRSVPTRATLGGKDNLNNYASLDSATAFI